MVRSGTTGLPNSKILLPKLNPHSLDAFSKLLKPRFSQKSRDATTIAPRKEELKKRQNERRNGGNTGIHGKRTRWGSTPPKGMEREGSETKARWSPTAARRCWRDEEERGGRANGYEGDETSPCPDITPWSHSSAVVPRWWAVVPLKAVVPRTTSGSTAQQPTCL